MTKGIKIFFLPNFGAPIMQGLAINNFDITGNGTCTYPLIWGRDAPNSSGGYGPYDAGYCLPGALNAAKVKGKIVFCSVPPSTTNILVPTAGYHHRAFHRI